MMTISNVYLVQSSWQRDAYVQRHMGTAARMHTCIANIWVHVQDCQRVLRTVPMFESISRYPPGRLNINLTDAGSQHVILRDGKNLKARGKWTCKMCAVNRLNC